MGGYRALSVKRVVLSLLLVATAILPGGGTGIARAAEAQCGPYSPTVRYFDGFDKKTSETYLSWGVSADITVRSTNLCTSNLNGSQNIVVTWSMITAHNGDGWAQTGYHRAAGDLTHHFWQWKQCLSSSCPVHTDVHYQHLLDGEVHQYWTGYISSGCPSSSSCLALRTDSTTWDRTTFNPNGGLAGSLAHSVQWRNPPSRERRPGTAERGGQLRPDAAPVVPDHMGLPAVRHGGSH